MNRNSLRFVFSLLIALLVMSGVVAPAYAQSSSPMKSESVKFEEVNLLMQDGWRASGRHAAADDFTIACPNYEVLDPTHPCSSQYSKFVGAKDLVLVCPVKEVLDPSHPCAERRAQIVRATADDFVLVCPIKEVLDPAHPCAEQNQHASIMKFKIPGDYVMTCPVKEVLDPGHPCARR